MAISPCTVLTDSHDRELVEHGSTAFPIACYADDLTKMDVPWHWHDEWEFAVVTSGCPEFFMEHKRIRIQTGDAVFVNGRVLHAVNKDPGQPSALHSAVFHPRLLGAADSVFWQDLVQPLAANESFRFIVLHADVPWEADVIRSFCRAWQAVADEGDDYENLARYELCAAVRRIIQNSQLTSGTLTETELTNAARIRTMLEYIDAHCSEEISLPEIAACVSVSTSVCLRLFNQMLHTTPVQYVKQLRLRKAADLLVRTGQSAKNIALACGFNDVSYFTKSFRELYGATPAEYRKVKK